MDTVTAYVGLGSNLGDRRYILREAIERLSRAPGVRVTLRSHLIDSVPIGGPSGQPMYLNAAVGIQTTLLPRELLATLQDVEQQLGRDREHEPRWGPRTCDLDLLLYGSAVIDEPDLVVPHPRMHERWFVLEPLARIAPAVLHPVLGKSISDLLAELEDAR